jgi:hypothetical protein
MATDSSRLERKHTLIKVLIGLPLLILALPILVIAILFYFIAGMLLHIVAWCWWGIRGRDVLFVYSDSPIWHDYIEEHILPRLKDRAIVLNWSERRRWGRTLSVLAFQYFGGGRNYNPMAVVFRPFRLARIFRFYKPFRDFKHGNSESLIAMEYELFSLLGANGRA